ncbi:MAG: type II secretion system minor pseudopilin GspK [Nitrospirota bacterium]
MWSLLTKKSKGLLRSNEGGFVLLLTLLVVLLLVIIIFEIDFQTRADRRAAGNFRDDTIAHYVALSGIAMGKAILKDDSEKRATTDDLTEVWAGKPPPFPVGDGEVTGAITDELGKFNLNSLINRSIPTSETVEEKKKKQLTRLFELLEVDPQLVDPIIDWIDTDDKVTGSSGAEDETYQTLPAPYKTKNKNIDILEEILLIKGIEPEIYKKISPYLTVYGDGKINVNTADLLILQSFHQQITEDEAKRLRETTYTKPSEVQDAFKGRITDIYNDFSGPEKLFVVQSNIFSMKSYGSVRNTKKSVQVVWDRGRKEYLYFKAD